MNLTFSMEAVLTKQVEMPACSPYHAWDEFSTLAAAFGLELLLYFSLSVTLFLSILQTHTHSSVTNEPAVKLMFCDHPANCRYAISAPRAAHALDLSLGVHLKDLRESRIQWSKGRDR